jgi:hypothetical protein
MTKLIAWVFLAWPLSVHAATYYASPTGNDTNTGAITSPFFSLNKAWTVLAPGDTLYLRGGTYAYTAQVQGYCVGINGTAARPVRIWAYPGEHPILTMTNSYVNNQQHWRGGVYFSGEYCHWKGLTFSGFYRPDAAFIWSGLYATDVNFDTFEDLVFSANGGAFIIDGNSKGNLILNCDSYGNWDYPTSGGNADGFGCNYISANDPSHPNVYRGCRAWWNGDDGFDGWAGNGLIVYEQCWSWYNGYYRDTFTPAGNGEGFKLGGNNSGLTGQTLRVYRNCVSAWNRQHGFDQNGYPGNAQLFNCSSYGNADWGYNLDQNHSAHEWRNNLSYSNRTGQVRVTAETLQSHNSYGGPNGIAGPGANLPGWDNNVAATDFSSLDLSQLGYPREPVGSVPTVGCLHLVSGSGLIDTGIKVGTAYSGAAPDRGAFEHVARTVLSFR